MKQTVTVNLTTRTANDWTPPQLTFGESLTLALRLNKNFEGEEVEANINVTSVRASVGRKDARPEGGKCSLKIGAGASTSLNTTDPFEFNSLATSLRDLINAVDSAGAYGEVRVVWADDSWLLFFGDQTEQVPLTVVDNGLWPSSYGHVHAWLVDGKWVHELRLIQLPVALTNSFDVVLPPAPEITRIQAGGTDGTFIWNEIQELYVPAEFRGAYLLRLGTGKTTLLSREDDIASIEAALQSLGAGNFKVSLPLSNRPNIEFIGDYAGLAQDLLIAQVEQSPVGDVTFTIDFDLQPLWKLLKQTGGPVTLPMEVKILGTDENDFATKLNVFTLDVTIAPPVSFPEIEEVPTLDLLRPYSPKTYVPFGAANELVGNKYYGALLGDGVIEEFVIATGLNAETVYVFGRENVSGGRQLINGTDFTVTIDNDNQVTVTSLTGPPDEDGWAFIIFSAHPLPVWAADLTVTVPQVIAGGGYPSLPDFMDQITDRVVALEAILPSTGPGAAASSTVGLVTVIPEISEVLFYRGKNLDDLFTEDGVDAKLLNPRQAPPLLPAVHDGTLTDPMPDPLPAAAAGTVWVAGARTLIPGFRGIASAYVEDDGFVASDGRSLYVASRDGATNSYYPAAFERTLYAMAINDKMLAVNRTLQIDWGVQLQLIHANCKAQWVMALQLGTFSAESSPPTLGLNLENVTWAAPVFSQPIVLSPLAQSHFFGVRIKREVASLLLDQQLYGVWGGNNDAAPASANFAIRARLERFDTENVTTPEGYLAWKLIGSIDIDETGKQTTTPARAIITS